MKKIRLAVSAVALAASLAFGGSAVQAKATVKNVKMCGDASKNLSATNVTKWKTSDKSIATVNKKGKVTAKKKGTVTITAVRNGMDNIKFKITVGDHNYKKTGVVETKGNEIGHNSYKCSLCKKTYNSKDNYVHDKIVAYKKVLPEGTPWDNSKKYECAAAQNFTTYGCAAFAYKLSDSIFGMRPYAQSKNYGKLRVGDLVYMNNSHFAVIMEVKAKSYVLCEGNYNSQVHYGREVTKTNLKSNATYMVSRY